MATYTVKNADGTTIYFEADGAGTSGDPFVPRSADATAILSALQSTLTIDGSASTQPISAVSLPLATDAATETKQDDGITKLTEIDTAIDSVIQGSELQVDVVAALPAGTNAIGKLSANDGVDIGDVDVATIAAGETHIGQVGASDTVVTLTASLDTSAYADGDVLFDTQELTNAVRTSGGVVILQSITVLDKDDQGAEMDLVFLDANTSLGTENAAVTIADADAEDILGIVNVSTYTDLVNSQIATVTGIGLEMKADASTSLWVAGITRGTPTYTAAGLIIKFAFLRS